MAIRSLGSSFLSTLRPWQRGSRGRKRLVAPLALAGLIPVLLSLLTYLLPTFSASGEVCGCTRYGDTLPEASNVENLEIAPIAVIDERGLTLDGRRMASATELAEGTPLVQFVQDLETMHRNWNVLHPEEPFGRHLIVAAGAQVPYGQVRVVARAAASAGYDELDLLVREREPGPSGVVTSYWSLMEQ